MAHLVAPLGVLVDQILHRLMSPAQVLTRGVLPAADQPSDLFGRQHPEPVQEVRHGIRVRTERGLGLLVFDALFFLADLRRCSFAGFVGLKACRLRGLVEESGCLRPGREQRLEMALLECLLEDHGRGRVERRLAGLGADTGPVGLRVDVLGVAGRDRHPRSDGLPDHLKVAGRLFVGLVDLPDGLAGQLAIGLGDGQPRFGDGPGIGRRDSSSRSRISRTAAAFGPYIQTSLPAR